MHPGFLESHLYSTDYVLQQIKQITMATMQKNI